MVKLAHRPADPRIGQRAEQVRTVLLGEAAAVVIGRAQIRRICINERTLFLAALPDCNLVQDPAKIEMGKLRIDKTLPDQFDRSCHVL